MGRWNEEVSPKQHSKKLSNNISVLFKYAPNYDKLSQPLSEGYETKYGWREHIESPDDIWNEIVKAAQIPGTTSAPKLQPIAARIVMLQSGMRAPMGVKIKGPDLDTIEQVGLEIERLLKEVPGVESSAVFADRIVGKPYL